MKTGDVLLHIYMYTTHAVCFFSMCFFCAVMKATVFLSRVCDKGRITGIEPVFSESQSDTLTD